MLLAGNAVLAQQGSAYHRDGFVLYAPDQIYTILVDSAVATAQKKTAELFRDTLDYVPEIYLVVNQRDFNRLLRGKFPDWGAAAAIPVRQRIVIKSPDHFNIRKPLTMLIVHEYCHLVMSQRTGLHRAPRWLDEGAAQYVSYEWDWSDYVAMSRAGLFGDFLKLSDIEMVNRFNETRAHLAYAQSYMAVEYFIEEYGLGQLNIMLDRLAAGDNPVRALEVATGATVGEFEQDYLNYIGSKYNLVTILMDTMFLWIGLAIVVIIGAVLKYRKRQEYYEKWEQEDQLQSTDFDYGDPDNPEQTDDDEPWQS